MSPRLTALKKHRALLSKKWCSLIDKTDKARAKGKQNPVDAEWLSLICMEINRIDMSIRAQKKLEAK